MKLVTKVVAGLVVSPLLLLVGGVAGCEARKAYYDSYIRRLCLKDGGAEMYERIKVSPAVAASMGRVGGHLSITTESASSLNDVAFLRGEPSPLRTGQLTVWRHEQAIIRRSDLKVIGRVVRYSRSGGDFPFTGSSPSAFSCPDWQQYYADIATAFVIEKDSK